MKVINTAVSFLLAATASAAKEKRVVKDLDGFAEQMEVAKAKHTSESRLRGNIGGEEDTEMVALDRKNRNNRRRMNDWLDYHK